MVSALILLQEKEWVFLHAFVIMPDHWHVLFNLGEKKPLPIVIKELCRNSNHVDKTREIRIAWQKGYFDHNIRDKEDVVNIARYIEANPVRKKLVENAGEWMWSSAHSAYTIKLNRSFLGHERWEGG